MCIRDRFGTRNPEYYAVTPGSCGVVNDDSVSGCRPLIAVVRATGAGIMGDGAIDGQGGARLMVDGKAAAKSWWDLAEDARTAGRQQVPRMIDTDLSDDFTLYQITLRNSANFHVAFHRGDGLTAVSYTHLDLGDVEEAVGAGEDFDEGAELGDADDLAEVGLADFGDGGDVGDHLDGGG